MKDYKTTAIDEALLAEKGLGNLNREKGAVGVFEHAFSLGWDACSRHEGSQKVANLFCDEVTLRRQQESMAVGIIRALNVAPNDPTIDAVIEVMNSAQPAPIVSHLPVDPSSVPYEEIHSAAQEWIRNYAKTASSKALSHGLQMRAAFTSGAHWQMGRQPVADKPEIGAPISEMPLTGLVLDKLNQVIEMLQRQNNRTDEFAGGVQNDLNLVVATQRTNGAALDKIINRHDALADKLGEQIERVQAGIEMQADAIATQSLDRLTQMGAEIERIVREEADEILGLMRPAEKEPSDNPLHDFFVTLTATLDATGFDVETLLTPAGQNDYARWLMLPKQTATAADESGQGAWFDAEHSADALSYMMTSKKFGKIEQQKMETVIHHQREQIGKLHSQIGALQDRLARIFETAAP